MAMSSNIRQHDLKKIERLVGLAECLGEFQIVTSSVGRWSKGEKFVTIKTAQPIHNFKT